MASGTNAEVVSMVNALAVPNLPAIVIGALEAGAVRIEELEAERERLAEWLARAYLALIRDGWEPGMSTGEATDRLNEVLDELGWPMERRLALLDMEAESG